MGHTSRPNERCPFHEVGYRSCSFSNSLLKGMTTGCLEFSPSCFSAEDHLCACLCVCVFFQLAIQKVRKRLDQLKVYSSKTARSTLCQALLLSQWLKNAPVHSLALGRMRGIMQSLISRFTWNAFWCDSFSGGKRQSDGFWHCLTSTAMLFLMWKYTSSMLLLFQVFTTWCLASSYS